MLKWLHLVKFRSIVTAKSLFRGFLSTKLIATVMLIGLIVSFFKENCNSSEITSTTVALPAGMFTGNRPCGLHELNFGLFTSADTTEQISLPLLQTTRPNTSLTLSIVDSLGLHQTSKSFGRALLGQSDLMPLATDSNSAACATPTTHHDQKFNIAESLWFKIYISIISILALVLAIINAYVLFVKKGVSQ